MFIDVQTEERTVRWNGIEYEEMELHVGVPTKLLLSLLTGIENTAFCQKSSFQSEVTQIVVRCTLGAPRAAVSARATATPLTIMLLACRELNGELVSDRTGTQRPCSWQPTTSSCPATLIQSTSSYPVFNIFTRVRKIVKSEYYLRNVCPSVLPHGTTPLLLDGISWNLIFEYFSKIGRGNSSSSKIGQAQRVLYVKTIIHFCYISLSSS